VHTFLFPTFFGEEFHNILLKDDLPSAGDLLGKRALGGGRNGHIEFVVDIVQVEGTALLVAPDMEDKKVISD
jgi:hypothetical protein